MRLALPLAALLAAACVPTVHVDDDCTDAVEPPEPLVVTARATLEMETGAALEALCPDGFEPTAGRCELGENVILIGGERLTEAGYLCDVWNEDDVVPRDATTSVTCE